MKKFARCNWDTIATLLPRLNENEQRNVIGGTSSCLNDLPTCSPVPCICAEMCVTSEANLLGVSVTTSIECTEKNPISTEVSVPTSSISLTTSEDNHSVMYSALGIAAALAADDVTGIGVVDDVAIPFVLLGAVVYEYIVTNDDSSYGNFGNPQDWSYTVPSQPFYEIPPVDNGNFGPDGASKWWLIPGGIALAKEIKDGCNVQIPYRNNSNGE